MRPPRVRLMSLTVGLVLALATCGSEGSGATREASPSATKATDGIEFSAAKVGGGTLSSASFQGKDTVLWFWAPWCTSCRSEAPNVVAGAEAFDGKVNVIGVAGRGEVADMEEFISDTGTEGLTHVVDDTGDIWSSYDVAAQPAFAFIGDDGSVDVVVGALGEDAFMEKLDDLAAA